MSAAVAVCSSPRARAWPTMRMRPWGKRARGSGQKLCHAEQVAAARGGRLVGMGVPHAEELERSAAEPRVGLRIALGRPRCRTQTRRVSRCCPAEGQRGARPTARPRPRRAVRRSARRSRRRAEPTGGGRDPGPEFAHSRGCDTDVVLAAGILGDQRTVERQPRCPGAGVIGTRERHQVPGGRRRVRGGPHLAREAGQQRSGERHGLGAGAAEGGVRAARLGLEVLSPRCSRPELVGKAAQLRSPQNRRSLAERSTSAVTPAWLGPAIVASPC